MQFSQSGRNRYLIVSIFIFSILFSCKTTAPVATGSADNDSIHTARLLSQRIFFLLYEVEKMPAVRSVFVKDKVLNSIYKSKSEKISNALTACENMDCLVKTLMITSEENQEIISALSKLFHDNKSLMKDFIRNQIRPTHAYAFYENYSDSALFVEAWKEQAKGFNYILPAYLKNKGFHYAKIDSSLLDIRSPQFLNTTKKIVQQSLKNNSGLFFKPFEDISIKLLQLNDRDEAIALMPLSVANGVAYSRIADTKWKDYPYSGILILGEGPEDPKLNISAGSKIRARMGAALYRDKKAPFIVVSGGSVHPIHTPYFEAVEMKKFLVDSLHIPAEVVIMEPHARHTTTNLRNTNRIFLKNGIPRNKPILTVTVKSHIDFIVSDRFTKTYLRDIGYIAYNGLKRLSDTTVSYYPTMSSFQINSQEPLDP